MLAAHEDRPIGLANLDLSAGERWYVVYALPHRESAAQMHLAAQGFRSFLPKRRKSVRHARKIRFVQAPVFPRYFFTILDLERDRWRSINGTVGVCGLIMGRERPIAVPEGIVEALIQSSSENGAMRRLSEFEPGERVRIVAGPFAQSLGVLDKLDDRGRVVVLLQIMGAEIRTGLVHDWIEKAG